MLLSVQQYCDYLTVPPDSQSFLLLQQHFALHTKQVSFEVLGVHKYLFSVGLQAGVQSCCCRRTSPRHLRGNTIAFGPPRTVLHVLNYTLDRLGVEGCVWCFVVDY